MLSVSGSQEASVLVERIEVSRTAGTPGNYSRKSKISFLSDGNRTCSSFSIEVSWPKLDSSGLSNLMCFFFKVMEFIGLEGVVAADGKLGIGLSFLGFLRLAYSSEGSCLVW